MCQNVSKCVKIITLLLTVLKFCISASLDPKMCKKDDSAPSSPPHCVFSNGLPEAMPTPMRLDFSSALLLFLRLARIRQGKSMLWKTSACWASWWDSKMWKTAELQLKYTFIQACCAVLRPQILCKSGYNFPHLPCVLRVGPGRPLAFAEQPKNAGPTCCRPPTRRNTSHKISSQAIELVGIIHFLSPTIQVKQKRNLDRTSDSQLLTHPMFVNPIWLCNI